MEYMQYAFESRITNHESRITCMAQDYKIGLKDQSMLQSKSARDSVGGREEERKREKGESSDKRAMQ